MHLHWSLIGQQNKSIMGEVSWLFLKKKQEKTLSEHTLCPVLQVDIASKRLSLFMVANRFVDVCKIGIQGKGFAKLLFFAVAKAPNL